MDKNAIKKYAIWARRELISRVSQRAAQYEITADGYEDQNAASVHGRILSTDEKKQRSALIAKIKEKGYEQVMEEIAYTWFNRFFALRFMEVNGYLPTRVRVFTDDENNFKPQILTEAINMELDGLDMQKVYDLKNVNDDDALFKYMIIVQCNALSKILPGMFQRISDYTELLFPDNLLREGSVVEQMIAMIPQEDWTDQVQIIGWLYQYYNTEPKDKVFANLKKNIKISKENIPAATQLFTPDWIVRYMVENSLGRLWLEGHPNNELKAEWKYYLDEAEQEPEVQAQLAEVRKGYAALKPEDILAIDPCQGSGHILAYMFDVLVQIYETYGYSAREAAASIVEHNIWGLDIDERAAQLAYFSVMMKARQYDRRFFSRGIQPHVYVILESNNLDPHCIEYFVDGRKELKSAMNTLVEELHDAKEYGSILNVTQVDFDALYSRFEEIQNETTPELYSYHTIDTLLPFVQVAQAMAQKYHTVVTNPPYMSASGMDEKLGTFVKNYYSDTKSDFFSVFVEKCGTFSRNNAFYSLIVQPSFLSLGAFEKLRKKLIKHQTICSLLHMGRGIFGIDFGSTSFCIRNTTCKNYVGSFFRLHERTFQYVDPDDIAQIFINGKSFHGYAFDFSKYDHGVIAEPSYEGTKVLYQISQKNFEYIPSSPLSAFTFSEEVVKAYAQGRLLGGAGRASEGVKTGNNDRFLRMWHEVDINRFKEFSPKSYKWISHHKGGDFRKWYGNLDWIINWEDDAKELKAAGNSGFQGKDMYYKEVICWSKIASVGTSFRLIPSGGVFDSGSPAFYSNNHILYYLAYLNSSLAKFLLKIKNPTINCQVGDVKSLPLVDDADMLQVEEVTRKCVEIAKKSWNDNERSWTFDKPILLQFNKTRIEDASREAEIELRNRFDSLRMHEEWINRHFLNLFHAVGQADVEVSDDELSAVCRKFVLRDEIIALISYAVGCMFGRYSFGESGLVFAGGGWDAKRYLLFEADEDNVIPVCDDEYFEDDIVGRFVKFIEVAFGKENLEENLKFIAAAINGKGQPREVIRKYFLNDFFIDHCNNYSITGSGKRPIYWLFDSGKKNGFKCLIYMHRYQPDTIARIRTDYVHEQQSRYRTAIADLESRIANAGTSERVKLKKQLDGVRGQAEELRIYEEKIHHLADQMIRIDLDDGVKMNYAKFQDVLAKIK